jgi:Tfp pilus assembly protein PilF
MTKTIALRTISCCCLASSLVFGGVNCSGIAASQPEKEYIQSCEKWIEREDLNRALVDCNKAIKVNPQSAHAYFRRATIYYNQRKYQKSLSDYNQSISLDDGKYNSYYNRSLVQDKLQKCLRLI